MTLKMIPPFLLFFFHEWYCMNVGQSFCLYVKHTRYSCSFCILLENYSTHLSSLLALQRWRGGQILFGHSVVDLKKKQIPIEGKEKVTRIIILWEKYVAIFFGIRVPQFIIAYSEATEREQRFLVLSIPDVKRQKQKAK